MQGRWYLRHPFKVCANCIHLACVNTDTSELHEGRFGIVHAAEAVSVPVVGDFVIIPRWNPSKILVSETKVQISSILSNPGAVIIEREDLATWGCCSGISSWSSPPSFIDVVPKVNLISQRDFETSRRQLTKKSTSSLRAALP